MNQEELKKLLKLREGLYKKLHAINEIVVPPVVVRPKAIKIDDWADYIEQKKRYDHAVYKKGFVKEKLEQELRNNKSEIIGMLPTSNMWFVTDDTEYAVAHQTDDWPGSNGNLLVRNKPIVQELTEVRPQIVN